MGDACSGITENGAVPRDAVNAEMKKACNVWTLQAFCFSGRPCGIRTCDQRIKSPLLYQLS